MIFRKHVSIAAVAVAAAVSVAVSGGGAVSVAAVTALIITTCKAQYRVCLHSAVSACT
jgi:hypothetical protein